MSKNQNSVKGYFETMSEEIAKEEAQKYTKARKFYAVVGFVVIWFVIPAFVVWANIFINNNM